LCPGDIVVWVSDVGAVLAAGLFGIGLGVGIIGGAAIGRIIDKAAAGEDSNDT
jgi:hypothetical protein